MHTLCLGLAMMVAGAGGNIAGIPHDRSNAAPAVMQTFREAVVNPQDTRIVMPTVRPENAVARQTFKQPRFRPVHRQSRKAQAAVLGAALGLFGGVGIGYVLTNRPDCDTCGLPGIMFGAPIGAVVGAIVATRH